MIAVGLLKLIDALSRTGIESTWAWHLAIPVLLT